MVIDGPLVPACLPGVPDHLPHSQLSDGLIWVICTQPACRPVAVGFGARNAPAHHRAYSPGASGCVQIALHIKKATVSGAHPSRKSPHAPLPTQAPLLWRGGSQALRKENEHGNKISNSGGKIENQQGALQVSTCKIALCVHSKRDQVFEQICTFSVIFLSS